MATSLDEDGDGDGGKVCRINALNRRASCASDRDKMSME